MGTRLDYDDRLYPDLSDTQQLLEPRKQCPPVGRKVAVMVSGLVQQFVTIGLGFGLSVMYAELVAVFHAERSQAVLIQGIYMGMCTGAGILFTSVIRKYGPGRCIVVGSLVSCAGYLVSSFATSLTIIIVCVGFLSGVGMCLCYLSAFVAVSWIFHEDPKVALVCLTIGSSMGQFVIPALYEAFMATYGWSGAFMILAGIALQCLPFGLIIHCSREYYVTGSDDKESSRTRSAYGFLCKDVVVWLLLINALFVALTGNVETWFIVDILMSRGFPRQAGSVIVTVIGFGNFLGRLTGTMLRFKCKSVATITHWIYICPVMAVAHALVVNLRDYYPLMAACVLEGLVFGICFSQSPTIMYEVAGHERYPQAMGLVNLMYGIGNLLSNVIGGIIRDSLGAYDVAFYAAIGTSIYMTFGAAMATVLIKKRKREDQKPLVDRNSPKTSYTAIE